MSKRVISVSSHQILPSAPTHQILPSVSTHQIIPSVSSLLRQQKASPYLSRRASLDSSKKPSASRSKEDALSPSEKKIAQSKQKARDRTEQLAVDRTREILKLHVNTVTAIRNRLAAGRKQKFYYLTVPGMIRVIEIFLSLLHVTVYGFLCTFYEDTVKIVIPPFVIGNTREMFFVLANYHSLMGSLTMVLAGIFNSTSNTALLVSLYPTLFDFIQFNSVVAASIALIQFHKQKKALILKVMPNGFYMKRGIAISGMLLAFLHLIGTIYDLTVVLQRVDYAEENINIDEEGNVKDEDQDGETPVLF